MTVTVKTSSENVLRNAGRYAAEETEVDLSSTHDPSNPDRFALIAVRDHGKGVPEESIREIFRPFYRVEDGRDRKTGGTALGLSIAARAGHLHQGTIKVSNANDGRDPTADLREVLTPSPFGERVGVRLTFVFFVGPQYQDLAEWRVSRPRSGRYDNSPAIYRWDRKPLDSVVRETDG